MFISHLLYALISVCKMF